MSVARSVLLIVLHCLLSSLCQGVDVSNGFNQKLDWKPPSLLLDPTFVNDKKAILFIFSQPWCGACTKLKASFMEDGEKLLDISKDFLLINVGGDDNNKFGAEFAPDGGYIPRIIFAEPNGTVRPDIKNPGAQGQYQYFYHSVDAVKAGMENALKVLAQKKAPAVESEKASVNAPKEAEKATDKTSEL
ncbi:probable thioredoxin domain-containing protein 12 [Coccomyxa sp. Obi]|nr:probable thioredoxin domain-containing protein 12 [Coccomyxa sp. Obi]